MIVKTYIVNELKEALIRATYELGRDAIIINQRSIRQGKWYNPFKKKKLEVTVAVEENNNIRSIKKPAPKLNTQYTEEDLIKLNPIFKNIGKKAKNQLLGYYKLNLKDQTPLNQEEIKDFLGVAFKHNCFEKKLRVRKVNVFIGPTGVGKTTTIAKIAAKESLENKKKVGLITIDTYRIGAVEQLKTYADILGIPCEVVKQPKDTQKKIRKLSHCDTILVDTLGTSQRNKEKLQDIKEYLDNIPNRTNVYLVLSISTDHETSLSILDKYKKLDYNALILTKLDEVNSFTNIWGIMANNSYPVKYLCHGQDVPEDISDGTLDDLVAYSEEIYKDDGSS